MSENPRFEVRFLQTRVEPRAQTLVGGLHMVAPPLSTERAPLHLVACVDVSGSMAGLKIVRAMDSLKQLVKHLSERDCLGIVTFGSDPLVLLPPMSMSAENKAEATRRIDALRLRGMTCMSGGLALSLELLAGPADPRALRRILLFTDGHANVGLQAGDLAGFSALLDRAPAGTGVSFFGYGEDHNGPFLADLAQAGNGNYHRVADADAILDAFGVELGGLLSVAAAELAITARPLPGAGKPVFLNDFRVSTEGSAATLHLPELYAEERRWVIFEIPFAEPATLLPPRREVVDLELRWLVPGSGERGRAAFRGAIELVDRAQVDPVDPELEEARTILLAAKAQREAERLVRDGRFDEARRVVLEMQERAAGLGTEKGKLVAMALLEVAEAYASAPAYASAQADAASLRVAFGKGKPSGTALGDLFETSAQTRMRSRFRGAPDPDSDDEA